MMKRLVWPRRTPFTLLLIAAVVGSVAWLITHNSHAAEEKKTSAAKAALSITTAQPDQRSLPISLSANGTIAAWQEAIIGSEANGLRLTDVKANVGDTVRAGQLLATFASESVAADLAQARATLVEAQANASDASGNAERAHTLQDTGALSTQQINQFLTSAQTAKARVAAARAALLVQQLRLQHTRLVAPDDGIISTRTATVGAVVSAGTELFRMIRKGRLEWRAEVTSNELARLRPGAAATLTAANGTTLKGKIRVIAPTVDAQNRIALVYVDLPTVAADQTAPKAGMFATGQFDLGSSTATTVPQQSVVIRDGFSYVFRVNPDHRVTQLKVRTGRRIGERIELLDTLPPATLLVVAGAGFLNDADLVTPLAEK